MKKAISLLLALILCTSFVTPAFASETVDTERQNRTEYISVMDQNGEYVQYAIKPNSVTTIPIYAQKESNGTYAASALVDVATLTIFTTNTGVNGYVANFRFDSTNAAIWLITLGFIGSFTTRNSSGQAYGTNAWSLPTLSGSVSASPNGTGTLSGTYTVIGYSPISILQGFST